jgi:hypothetical protein
MPLPEGDAEHPAGNSSPHPEEARRAVSKDVPEGSEASWTILREAATRLLRMRAKGVYGQVLKMRAGVSKRALSPRR